MTSLDRMPRELLKRQENGVLKICHKFGKIHKYTCIMVVCKLFELSVKAM